MPSPSNDPDSYTLEEMVERLKKRGHDDQGDPELVTREDGTQAVRVRKRKRRSNQPHRDSEKRKSRTRVLQVVALVGTVLCCAVLLVGLFAYHNSRVFQQRLLDKIAAVTGGEPELTQFRVTPVAATAQSASLRWQNHPELRELRLNMVNADLRMTSFVGGRWTGEEVFARSGTLILGEPGEAVGGAAVSAAAPGADPLPFRFARYRCQELQVLFGQNGRPPLQTRGVEASVYPIASGVQLRLNGGMLSALGWPELRLDRGLIEFGPGEVNIPSLRFSGGAAALAASSDGKGWGLAAGPEDSAIELQGSFDPRSTKPVFLDVSCSRFPSDGLLGKSLSRLFTTVLDGKGSLSFVPRDFNSHELVLPFEASGMAEGAYLGGLPFLDLLKTELQEARFAVPQFQNEVEGVLRRHNGLIEISDLRLEQKSFLAVRGRMTVGADGRLDGSLDVGVADRLMSGDGMRFIRRAFAEARDGYRWTHVKLSGNVQSPKDDFGQTVRAAYQTKEGDTVLPGGATAPEARDPGREFEDLIKPGPLPPADGSR